MAGEPKSYLDVQKPEDISGLSDQQSAAVLARLNVECTKFFEEVMAGRI